MNVPEWLSRDVPPLSGVGAEGVPQTVRWVRLILCMGMLAVTVALAIFGYSSKMTGAPTSSLDTGSGSIPKSRQDMQGKREDLHRALQAFLSSSTIDEQIECVRHPDRTRSRMELWERRGESPLTLDSVNNTFEDANIDNADLSWLSVTFTDGSKRTAIFEWTPAGPKLDWESLVFYSAIPWKDYLQHQPPEPQVFRVLCQPDDYFTGAFLRPEDWVCYQVTDPQRNGTCWGYVASGSALAATLGRLFEVSETRQLMVQLQFPDEEEAHPSAQAVIVRLVSDTWMLLDE
ncbi:MAG: hypothetical protein KDN22_07995 [Verrucomicrobiae bacterium]|nr:hypothetical protein [Verrucomicrobiae bacterium]